jgi:hypothetical protein
MRHSRAFIAATLLTSLRHDCRLILRLSRLSSLRQHCRLIVASSLPTYIAALQANFLYGSVGCCHFHTHVGSCCLQSSMRPTCLNVASLPTYHCSALRRLQHHRHLIFIVAMIATHLRSQALAAFLLSYDTIVLHSRSQALAAHLPSYLFSGIIATHSCSQALTRQILCREDLSPNNVE